MRWAFHPAHRQDEWKSNELFFALLFREGDAQLHHAAHGEPDTIKAVCDVHLKHVDGPVLDVCIVDALQDTLQGSTILHRVRRESLRRLVHTAPRVVNDQTVPAVTLRDEASR